jgi:hypothetical protein
MDHFDHAGGYVSTDRELWVKLLWENANEKGFKLPKAEVPEWKIVVGLRRTCVNRSSTPEDIQSEETRS